MKKTHLLPIVIFLIIGQNLKAQFSTKLNGGMSFSEPGDDLKNTSVKGKALQLFASLELGYHLDFTKKTEFGIRGAFVVGQDYANFLSADRLTELKFNIQSYKARIYPFSFSGSMKDGFEKIIPIGWPLIIEYPTWLLIYSTFNSLHFDYGKANSTILETAFIEEANFEDVTVKREMKFIGWGVQPMIYESDSRNWTWNAVFDFGRFIWTNANGGISSIKSNHVGFGVQYHFIK